MIIETIRQHLPHDIKQGSNGWMRFDCRSCVSRGESRNDTKNRGNIIFKADTFSYNCFNCSLRLVYSEGSPIYKNLENFMISLGISEDEIKILKLSLLKYNKVNNNKIIDKENFNKDKEWKSIKLPQNFIELQDNEIINYLKNRMVYDDYKFYSNKGYKNSIIIPSYYNESLCGYTIHNINNKNKKYISHNPKNYMFNFDTHHDKNYIILTEGVYDALSINCISMLNNRINDSQAKVLQNLYKNIIVVPDNDNAGKSMIMDAIKYGFNVCLPIFDSDVKDVNDAVIKYGKLFTLNSILSNYTNDQIKIKLMYNIDKNFDK